MSRLVYGKDLKLGQIVSVWWANDKGDVIVELDKKEYFTIAKFSKLSIFIWDDDIYKVLGEI